MKNLLTSLGMVVALLLGGGLFTRTQAAVPPHIPATVPASLYKISSHEGTFVDISTNPNAVALGNDLSDGADLWCYFFEPTEAGGTTPTSKKVTTTLATYNVANATESEFCFPLGFDFKISGRTMKYFLVSAIGGAYFSPTPQRAPANYSPGSSNYVGNQIHVSLYHSTNGTSMSKISGAGKISKPAGKAPAYYLIEGTEGHHVLTTQHHIVWTGGDEWVYQCKFYEETGNFELVVGDLETDKIATAFTGTTYYYGVEFGLSEAYTSVTGAAAVNDTINPAVDANRPWQLGIQSYPSGGQHKWYASRYYSNTDNGWNNPGPMTSGNAAKSLQVKPGDKPESGRTIRFTYPPSVETIPAFPESDYGVGTTNTDDEFTVTLKYKDDVIRANFPPQNLTELGTIVAISSANDVPDFTLENGTFYFKGYQFPESDGFVPTVLCNQMSGGTMTFGGNPPGATITLTNNPTITLKLTSLEKFTSRYIHVYRMMINGDGRPVYSPLCFTIAREPVLDPPALLETVGMPTVNSVKLHAKPADGLSVLIIKSKKSINLTPKGVLKKGDKIGTDAEVVDVLSAEKTWDCPMTAGEGCYFLAYTVDASNPNKYVYSSSNRLWVPARAAYNGLPGLLDMSKEIHGTPNKELDGYNIKSQGWASLEGNTYRDLPLGWTRELDLADGKKHAGFGLGQPSYASNVAVALYGLAPFLKVGETFQAQTVTVDAVTAPILANKTRVIVTCKLQYWKADASGLVEKTTPGNNDQFQIQYAIGSTNTWQNLGTWTGATMPELDKNNCYSLTASFVDENLVGQYIRFRFVSTATALSNGALYFSIPSVEIKEDKVCKAPTNLKQTISQTTTTSLPLTWTDPNPSATKATSYLISYKRSGAVGDWAEKTVNTNNVTLTGLRSSTTYMVRMTAVCGEDGDSYPTDTTYFTTAYTFPYTEAMARRDTVINIQGTWVAVPQYSPFPYKSNAPQIPKLDGGVNTYKGQLPNSGTATLTLSVGDGSDAGVFSHLSTYNNKANIKVADSRGNKYLSVKSVGVGEQAQYAWVVTPVVYAVNLVEDEPLTVRFKARSASRAGSDPWSKGSVGSKYNTASLKVLVSNTGDFSNADVIGTVDVGGTVIDSTLYAFDLPQQMTGSVQVAFYYANPNYIDASDQTAFENNNDYMTFEIFDVRFEYKNEVALCPALEGLERTFLTPHSATFSWAPSDSAKYYEFAYGPADEEEYANVVKLTEAEYTMTDLGDETAYKVKVTGYCDEEGENAAPDPLTAEFTTPEGCHTPSLFKIQDVTYYGATFISSQTQSILDEREILIISNDDESFTKLYKQTKDTLVQEKGLHDNMSYVAKTRSICRYGAASVDTSEWSNGISFTTPVDPANLPDTFNVILQVTPAGAGTVTGARKYVEDETITLKATPNEGYIFKGWVNADNDTVSRNLTYTMVAALEDDNEENIKTHNLTFTAVFRKVYTITLNTQPTGTTGGTVTGEGTYDEGKQVTLTATPKSAYVFVEWQDGEGNQVSTNATYKFTPTASATYTAVFRLKQYYTLDVQVTPNDDWGSVTVNRQPNEDDQYAEGLAVTLTAVPAQYCKFVEWQDADGKVLGTNTSYTVSMDNNRVVKAVFAQIRYTVTLKSDPNTTYGTIKGTSGSTTTGGTFVAGTTRRVVAQPKSGYAFVKWMSGSLQLGTDTVFQFVLTRDTTLTAYFKQKDSLDVKVNVSPAGAGTVTGTGKVKRGENAVLTATPNAHYAFKEWKRLDNTTVKSNPYTFKPDRDYTFTAVFRDLEQYTITVPDAVGGTVTGAGTYEEGSQVTLTATADEHHYFAEWQDEAGETLSTDATYTFTAEGNTTVKAVFSENAKLTVTLQRLPSSTAGSTTGAGSYEVGTEVIITATPAKGYKFVEWQKTDGTTLSTNNPYTFTITASVTYRAVFEALCEIKVTVDPVGAATVTGAGTYDQGDEVTLTATVDDSYVFEEWRDATSGLTLSTVNPYTFTASTSQNIKAVLREKGYFSIDVPCVGDDEDENDPGRVTFSPEGDEGEWMEGTTVTMTATPAPYYTFVEWQDVAGNTLGTNPSYSFVITQDTTFTAVFSRIQYTVTLVSNPSKDYGTITGTSGITTDGGTFDAGSKRRLEAKPKSGYAFEKWMSGSLQLGTNPVLEFILTQDTTITAYFKEKDELDIKVTVLPAGAGTVTGAGKVKRGENAVLTAIPDTYYKFLYWERVDGTQHEENPYTLVQPKRDYSFTAQFRAKEQYTVTVMNVPNIASGTVTMTGLLENGKALEDATVTLTAVPAEGYAFKEWQDAAGKQVGTSATLSFTATANVVYKAVFEEIPIPQYHVTLLRDPVAGGRIFGDGDHDANSEVSIRAQANKGYTFEGWFDGTTKLTAELIYTFTITADVTYTAKFKERDDVDVAVDVLPDNGAGSVTGAGTYAKNQQVTLTAVPAEGYVFYRWVDADNDNEAVSTQNPYIFTATQNVHYAAEFRGQYEVALNILPDESAGEVTGAGFYRPGRSVTITATAAAGYTFVGWLDEAGNTVTTEKTYTFTVAGNVTYTAKFEAESENGYTITLKRLPNNDAGTVKGNGRYAMGEEVTLVATPAENYMFVAWLKPKAGDPTQYDTVSKRASYTITVGGDATYAALFRLRARYTIEVDILPNDNAGTVTGDGEYREGRTVTLEATPNAGYVFVAWVLQTDNPMPKDTVSRMATYTFTASKSATYKAVFKRTMAKYTLNLNVSPANGGTVTGDGIYNANQTVTLTATPNAGYTFVGWRLLNGSILSRDLTYQFQITRDMTITAVFNLKTQRTVTLNVTPEEAGTVTGDGKYDDGATVTITATPNEGYRFVEWQDAESNTVSTEASYTFVVTANVEFTAVFSDEVAPAKEYTINLNVLPERSAGTVAGAGTYKEGTMVSITATANAGYTFVQWQDAAGRTLSTSTTYTFKATANVIYSALFKKNVDPEMDYTVTLNVLPNPNAGTVTGNGVYKGGQTATITAKPSAGYAFVAWMKGNDTLSKEASYSFMVAADVTYTALFKEISTANEQSLKAAFNVGAGNGHLYIENINDVVVKEVTVFNTVGRRLAHFAPNRRGDLALPVDAPCSVLVVRVVSEQGAAVYKVYMK